MKNEKLQPSEALAKYFSPRRKESPLLSAPEIEKLLAERIMLPNPSHINVRKIIMTLSALTGLGIASYLAFFSYYSQGTNGTHRPDPPYATYSSHVAPATSTLSTHAKPAATYEKPTSQPSTKPALRGPWSAGNDQIYADLSPKELARMGIFINGDTVDMYKLGDNNSVQRGQVSYHYIGCYGLTKSVPSGTEAHHFFPELMTFGNGNGAAWQSKDGSCGMIPSEILTLLVPWLTKPGTPGYHALGFENHRAYNGVGYDDTLRLQIGKDFPMPAPFPFVWTPIDEHWDSVKDEVMQLAHYYEGAAPNPGVALPKTMILRVDTVTPQNLLDQLDQAQNSGVMEHLRSIVSRLNELVPVIVRMTPGNGTLSGKDFILWYEPSDELFAALPPAQAAAFRTKLAEPPHCMNVPEAVTAEAEVTYCVSEEQQVNVRVFDLMGHTVMSETQHAEAGDNIAKINTRTLPSGMYIILVQDNDGGERTRRIWVQNAIPK